MKVSTPPSYQDIFTIYNGTALNQYTVPNHRALFIASAGTTNLTGVTIENIDGTTGGLPVITNTATLIPLVIKKITAPASLTNVRIYGLL